MSAYLVGHIKVKDEPLWQEYVAGVKESLAPFDCTLIFRGRLASVLAGVDDRDLVVVIEFADMSTLERWFRSDSYQGLIPIRDRAADVTITTYEAYGD